MSSKEMIVVTFNKIYLPSRVLSIILNNASMCLINLNDQRNLSSVRTCQ